MSQLLAGRPEAAAVTWDWQSPPADEASAETRRRARLRGSFQALAGGMIGLAIFHYNFCRRHGTLKTTPAVANGLTDHEWTVRELLQETSDS